MNLTVAMNEDTVEIPSQILGNLAEFREWAGKNDLPEKTRTDYYKGEVWVDMSKEQIFTHGSVKTEIAAVLSGIVKSNQLGNYWCNGVLVSNLQAELSGNPDGTFVSFDSLASGRVTLTEGDEGGFVEVVGTVDMVLEVVSRGSVKKDSVFLRKAYWEAGIPEYWLVDARGAAVEFHILKHGVRGYGETRTLPGGWLKSAVFDKSFRIVRGTDRRGNPTFTLEVK